MNDYKALSKAERSNIDCINKTMSQMKNVTIILKLSPLPRPSGLAK